MRHEPSDPPDAHRHQQIEPRREQPGQQQRPQHAPHLPREIPEERRASHPAALPAGPARSARSGFRTDGVGAGRAWGLHCTFAGVTVNRRPVTPVTRPAAAPSRCAEDPQLRFSIIASALVAALVGFGSTLAIIVEAARHLGATPAQLTSWIAALCLGMARDQPLPLPTLPHADRHRVVTGRRRCSSSPRPPAPRWATPSAPSCSPQPLTILAGAVPALGAAIGRLPASIGGGMLAGLLLRFALGAVHRRPNRPRPRPAAGRHLPARAAVPPGFRPLVVIAGSPLPLAGLEGYAIPGRRRLLPHLVWMPPEFSVSTLVSLGIPLFLVTMATQQISGIAVLRTYGYAPPVSASFVITGLTTLLLAPIGGFSVNLSSVTASICTGPDTHPDPAKRYLCGPVFALCYLLLRPRRCGAGRRHHRPSADRRRRRRRHRPARPARRRARQRHAPPRGAVSRRPRLHRHRIQLDATRRRRRVLGPPRRRCRAGLDRFSADANPRPPTPPPAAAPARTAPRSPPPGTSHPAA